MRRATQEMHSGFVSVGAPIPVKLAAGETQFIVIITEGPDT